jgi:hypothetical protein
MDTLGEEVEILHLKKRMKLDGDIYDREVAYLSDHQVFHRFGKNGDFGPGWSYWRLWERLDEVYEIARRKKARGWQVEFNPAWQPRLSEFSRSVRF